MDIKINSLITSNGADTPQNDSYFTFTSTLNSEQTGTNISCLLEPIPSVIPYSTNQSLDLVL